MKLIGIWRACFAKEFSDICQKYCLTFDKGVIQRLTKVLFND